MPFPVWGPLNDARYVGHHERTVVAVVHYAQIGHQSGEWIIGNLRFGGRYRAEQRALARIGKPNKAHIGQQFELKHPPLLLSGLTGLGIGGGLMGGCGKVPIAEAAPAARQQDHLLPILGHLAQYLIGVRILGHSAQRHLKHLIAARPAGHAVAVSAHPVLGLHVFAVAQVEQGPQLSAPAQDHVSATATVTPVRAAFGQSFGAVQMRTACPALSRAAADPNVVYEI
jgi:hypothetical protein